MEGLQKISRVVSVVCLVLASLATVFLMLVCAIVSGSCVGPSMIDAMLVSLGFFLAVTLSFLGKSIAQVNSKIEDQSTGRLLKLGIICDIAMIGGLAYLLASGDVTPFAFGTVVISMGLFVLTNTYVSLKIEASKAKAEKIASVVSVISATIYTLLSVLIFTL